LTIPAVLNTKHFRASWEEWIEYRRERRLTLTPATLTRQLKRLAEVGPEAAVEAIEAAISAGWAGLFPEKRRSGGRGGHFRPRAAGSYCAAVQSFEDCHEG